MTDLAVDPRVNRQIRLLSACHRVLAAGTAPPNVPGVEFVALPGGTRPLTSKVLGAVLLKLGKFERFYWSDPRVKAARARLAHVRADVIIANDLATLPLAIVLANGAKIMLDAHEYAPREHEDRFVWRFFLQDYADYLCRRYLSAADGMLTVCEGIADEYRARYGVAPRVLMNAPDYADLRPTRTDARIVRLVHHGGAQPGRRIETMIGMMQHLDERFHLDLMLVPSDPGYAARLRALAEKQPRVRMLPPVPMRDLPQRLNEYDIGVYLLPPNSFNNRHALPNKFFEFIQGRLAVAIGPSPEMARLVRQYGCGIVAEDFDPRSLARALNALDAREIGELKQRAHAAAADLCFEKNSAVLLEMVGRLTATPALPQRAAAGGAP